MTIRAAGLVAQYRLEEIHYDSASIQVRLLASGAAAFDRSWCSIFDCDEAGTHFLEFESATGQLEFPNYVFAKLEGNGAPDLLCEEGVVVVPTV